MELNADFTKRAAVHGASTAWLPSPIAGVERRMLDRVGDEVARATTIVRYATGSQFSAHTHGGGEEFFVLEGVFTDEHGDYPTGSCSFYVASSLRAAKISRLVPGCGSLSMRLWRRRPDRLAAFCGSRVVICARFRRLPCHDPCPRCSEILRNGHDTASAKGAPATFDGDYQRVPTEQ
jgi:hypothetical protein